MSNVLFFARGSSPQRVCVIMGGLTPSSDTGLCVAFDLTLLSLTHRPSDIYMCLGRLACCSVLLLL